MMAPDRGGHERGTHDGDTPDGGNNDGGNNDGVASRRPWAVSAEGLTVTVRLTPKGGRDAIDGIAQLADGRCVLKARVAAAPTEGEANDALVRLLARTLGVPARDVILVGGATSRIKRMLMKGDAGAAAAVLERLGAEAEPRR